MKIFSEAAQAAIESGDVIVSGAVEIMLTTGPLRLWGGDGLLSMEGEEFTGVGDRALAQVSAGAIGDAAQSTTLTLSGTETANLALVDMSAARRAPVRLWRLIFNGAGTTLLDAQVYTRGRIDRLPVEETPGGEATITAEIETAARSLGRSGGRMRTDPDQRLDDPNDAGCSLVGAAANKILNWGGKPSAAAGQVVNAGVTGGAGFTGFGAGVGLQLNPN